VHVLKRLIKQTVVTIEVYHFHQLISKLYPPSFYQGSLHMQRKLMVISSVDFDATSQLLTIHCAFIKCFRMNVNSSSPAIDKLACNSVMRELLCNILTEFDIP
jgi:hypothetical protein